MTDEFRERRTDNRREIDRWKEATDKWKVDLTTVVENLSGRVGEIEEKLEVGEDVMSNLTARVKDVQESLDRNTSITVENTNITKGIAAKQAEIAEQTSGIVEFLRDFDIVSKWTRRIFKGFKTVGTTIIWIAAVAGALGVIVYVYKNGLPSPPSQGAKP